MPYPFSIAFRRDISCVMFSCTKIDVRLSLWKLLGGEYDPDTWPLEFIIDCFGDVSNPVDEFLVGKQQRNGPMHSDLMLGETASDLFLTPWKMTTATVSVGSSADLSSRRPFTYWH